MSTKANEEVLSVLAKDGQARRGRRWVKALVLALLALAAGAAVMAFGLRGENENTQYRTEALTRGDLQVVVTATGTVGARNTVEVGAEVTGRLVEVAVDFNDQVKLGQILARIDPVPFQLDVTQAKARLLSARASLTNAEATLAEARRNLERAQALAKDGLVSRQELDGAQATTDRAKASRALTNANVAEAKASAEATAIRLDKTTIRSPIAGIVLDRKVEVGQTVTAGFQTPVLFSLATDLAEMELKAAVDEADVGQVAEGQAATFTVDAFPDRTFQAKVLSIHNVPRMDQNVVTYETVLAVENNDRALRPGMTATVTIITSKVKDALLVPNGALRFKPHGQTRPRGGGPRIPFMGGPPRKRPQENKAPQDPDQGQVWIIREGAPAAVTIRKGQTDGDHTVVLEGDLAPGTEVILDIQRPPEGP